MFRKGIEDEIVALAKEAAKVKQIRAEDGILVRQNHEDQPEPSNRRLK